MWQKLNSFVALCNKKSNYVINRSITSLIHGNCAKNGKVIDFRKHSKVPGVARGIKKNQTSKIDFLAYMLPPGYPWGSSTNFRQFGPAVWPAIAITHTTLHRNIYERRALLHGLFNNYWINFLLIYNQNPVKGLSSLFFQLCLGLCNLWVWFISKKCPLHKV